MLADRVGRSGADVAFRTLEGGVVRSTSWSGLNAASRVAAAGLIAAGVERGDRVAILGRTHPRWVEADLAVMRAGAVTVAVYPTSGARDVRHVLSDSGATVVIADDASQVDKLVVTGRFAAEVHTVVVFERGGGDEGQSAELPDGVLDWTALCDRGEALLAETPDAVEARSAVVEPEHLATLVYTSGTSGVPKGVELLHEALVFETAALAEALPIGANDSQLLFLPLAHVLGRLTIFLALRVGFTTAFASDPGSRAESTLEDEVARRRRGVVHGGRAPERSGGDSQMERVLAECETFRPTVLVSVPRFYERIQQEVRRRVESGGRLEKRVFDWAVDVGSRMSDARSQGGEGSWALGLSHRVSHNLVFERLHERLGGEVRLLLSGAAPLARDTAELFDAAGLPILEGYGLTETSGAVTVSRPGHHRVGSVGEVLPGVQVRIADDGEIQVSGDNLMRGYHGRPDLTRAVLSDDGWLSTGDLGRLDDDGHLVVTGRKKQILITSTGKKIAPAKLELALEESPYIAHALVVADRRPYAVALLSLHEEAVREHAKKRGVTADFRTLSEHPTVRKLVEGIVDEVNEALSGWETVKRFAVLGETLSADRGELTPTLKVRRDVVLDRYEDVIEGLYD